MPFINPINYIDWDHPDDRAGWHTQNDALLALDPPYVYHVHKDNATQLGEALRQAIETPIPRFIREYEQGEHSEPANPEVELGELGGLGALRQRLQQSAQTHLLRGPLPSQSLAPALSSCGSARRHALTPQRTT